MVRSPHFTDHFLARWFLGEALVELGQFDVGNAALERALELSGRSSRMLGYLGYGDARARREDEARRFITEPSSGPRRATCQPTFPR